MEDLQTIKILINKIENGLPDIKSRSISSIYSKITVGILEFAMLPKYNSFPGILLNWINENMEKGQTLFKVLTILNYYAKTQEGLLLLEKYEALDFFKSFKEYLLQKQPKNDQFTNILEQMIKELLALSPQTSNITQVKSISENSVIKDKKAIEAKKQQKNEKSIKQVLKDGIKMTWIVRRQALEKKEQEQLYGVLMELKHSKKQLHLEWLKKIEVIIKYWGYKWSKYRLQLINQLTEQFPTSRFKWLIINILRLLIVGVGQNAIDLQDGLSDIVNLNASKQISKPETDKITLAFKNQLFESIYSGFLIQDLIRYNQVAKESNLYDYLLYMKFKFSYKYFYKSFQETLKKKPRALIQEKINDQISYYCLNFQVFRQEISKLITHASPQWNLSPQQFPILQNYLLDLQKQKSSTFLLGFDNDWQLGNNLHKIDDVMNRLWKGVQGIQNNNNASSYLRLYINSLLTLAISVQKQDPLMIHYKKIKELIIKISENSSINLKLFQEILKTFNKQQPLKYGNKNYSITDLAIMVFSQQTIYHALFCSSLSNEQSIACWLQITKRLIRSNELQQIDRYIIIYYSLTYHKNQEIKNLSKLVCQKISKNGKRKLALLNMFSKSEEERKKICEEIFGNNSKAIELQLQSPIHKAAISTKKPLKIQPQSLINYINIIINKTLQEQIRISGAKQLLQTLERIDLSNITLQQCLMDFSSNIFILLSEYNKISLPFLTILIQLNHLLNTLLQEQYNLKIQDIIPLLQKNLSTKIIQILLQQLYILLFQNPFSKHSEIHFIQLLYPHIKVMELTVSKVKVEHKNVTLNYQQKEERIKLQKYEQTLQFQHFLEDSIFKILNGEKVEMNDIFIGIFQKQIGQILHANKGYINLQYLAYGLQVIHENNIILPQKIVEYSSPILNNLLSKDQSSLNTIPTAQIIAIIGFKKTKQIQAIIQNNPPGLWKFYLLNKLQIIQPSLFEIIIKGLLCSSYGEESNHIINLILRHHEKIQLSMFSQTLILSSCVKFIKQESDSLLRQSSLCLLLELFGTSNFQCQNQQDLLSSVISILLQFNLSINLFALAITLLRKIIQTNGIHQSQKNLIKILLNKLISLLSSYSSNRLLQGSILQLINLIAFTYNGEFLLQYELVDTNIAIVYQILQRKQVFNEEINCIVSEVLRFLFIWIGVDKDLPKYLLTSTKILNNLMTLCSAQIKGDNSADILESIGSLWLKISQHQEDLFIYKLSQIMKTSIMPLFTILCLNLRHGGLQFLKMICWNLVIWNRSTKQQLAEESIIELCNIVLSSKEPSLIKLILPFSLEAKSIFLSSPFLQDLLKNNSNVLDNRIVKQTKDKKKKINKLYELDEKDKSKLIIFLQLLSSFFYWSDNSEVSQNGNQNLKKIIAFLQKFYSCGQWQEQISKLYLKTMTNLALCTPFSNFCSSRFSQNGIMMQQILGCISRSQSSDSNVKFSLKMLSVLVHLESIRNMVIRARIIQQLCQKLNKHEQKNDLNIQYTMDIIELFLSLSPYKDANIRLLSDKKVLDMMLRILKLGKFSIMEQKIVTLLANLACFKANKPTFMSNRDIHKIILGLLQDQDISYHSALLALLYNIIYKNSAGLKLYRRAEVIDVIRRVRDKQPSQICECLLQSLQTQQIS